MELTEMKKYHNYACPCGKVHDFNAEVIAGKDALLQLPRVLGELGTKKPYVLCDKNTYAAAGERVVALARQAGCEPLCYMFTKDELEPDESNVGLAVMHYTGDCDAVIGVGSGVINDIGKIVAGVTGRPYIIVGTAPSMDGYASATSSMTRAGMKLSLDSKGADYIIGDTDILCAAPIRMMLSGLGDMVAKYVSICEWRIANLINGEYYCEEIAGLVRTALKACVDNADGLLRRDPAAVEAVFNGLVLSGAAMSYVGLSRPASGVEHYFSHCWDMRAVEFGTPMDFHGIQCGIGTLTAVRLYERLCTHTPDAEKARACVEAFDGSAWEDALREFFGRGAESMIALEKKEKKYDVASHAARLPVILEKWEDILRIIKQELPNGDELEAMYDRLGMPKTITDIGLPREQLAMTFKSTKDIRDKYVLSRLCWDLGILDEYAEAAR